MPTRMGTNQAMNLHRSRRIDGSFMLLKELEAPRCDRCVFSITYATPGHVFVAKPEKGRDKPKLYSYCIWHLFNVTP